MGNFLHALKSVIHHNQLALSVLLGSLCLTFLSWQVAVRQQEADQQLLFVRNAGFYDHIIEQEIDILQHRFDILGTTVARSTNPAQLQLLLSDAGLRAQYPGMAGIGFVPVHPPGDDPFRGEAGAPPPQLHPSTPGTRRWLAKLLNSPQGQTLGTGAQPSFSCGLDFPGLPARDSVCLMTVPLRVQTTPTATGHFPLRGDLIGVFDLSGVLADALGKNFSQHMNVVVQGPDNRLLFASAPLVGTNAREPPILSHAGTVKAGGGVWTVNYTYRPRLLPRGFGRVPLLVLLSGLAMSTLVTAVIWQTSARQRATRMQLEREQQFRSLYANNPDAVASYDTAGRFRQVNAAFSQLLGVSSDAVHEISLTDFVAPDFQRTAQTHFDRAAAGETQTIELPMINSRGERLLVNTTFLPIVNDNQINGVFAVGKDVTLQKTQEAWIQRLSNYDTLTNLPNRSVLFDRLEHAIVRAREEHSLVALLVVDLDRFKNVNETLGHLAGDMALVSAAQRLRETARKDDTVARLVGDQFAVLREGLDTRGEAEILADELLTAVSRPYRVDEHEIRLTASVGIAINPLDAENAHDLLKAADIATDQAKSRSRNSFQRYESSMFDRLSERVDLSRQLRRALENHEFRLMFQPKVNLHDGAIIGSEALVRWQHPDMGLLAPAHFIPLAEETGLIDAIGEWVLRAACEQIQLWNSQSLFPPPVAVNVSAHQFRRPDFEATVRRILADTGVSPSQIEFELTEGMLMEDLHLSMGLLATFKGMGISLALDDFGTGYSSLSYLTKFPLDVLKIDRSFIIDVPGSHQNSVITETIVSLAQSLKLAVVAEGVESAEQVEFLRARGVACIQGYYFSKPLANDALASLLLEQRRFTPSPAIVGAAGARP